MNLEVHVFFMHAHLYISKCFMDKHTNLQMHIPAYRVSNLHMRDILVQAKYAEIQLYPSI